MQLDARAIIEGWDVPTEERPRIVQRLIRLSEEAEGDRDVLRACEALMKVPGMQMGAAQLKIHQEKWKVESTGAGAGLADLLKSAAEYDKTHPQDGESDPGTTA